MAFYIRKLFCFKAMNLFSAILIFITVFAFEWDKYLSVLFQSNEIVFYLKLIPVTILAIFSLFQFFTSKEINKNSKNYILLLSFFLIWGLFVTIINTYPTVYLIDWYKISFRFLFFLAAFQLIRLSANHLVFAFGIVGLLVFIQYLLLVKIFYSGHSPALIGDGVWYWGWRGVLGNQIAAQSIEGTYFTRLTSFWREPSIASGFLASTFYLLGYIKQNILIKILRGICFLSAVLCLSNAGYLALIWGFGVWDFIFILKSENRTQIKKSAVRLLGCIVLSWLVLFGRGLSFVSMNVATKAIFGVRQEFLKKDPLDGRSNNLKWTIDRIEEKPLGYGFLMSARGEDVAKLSSSAPVYWLYFSGVIGLIVICLQKSLILKTALDSRDKKKFKPIFSAFVALSVQNLSYGNWFTPHYFVIVCLIFFVSSNQANKVS